jgi:hypothetical protein
MGPNLVDDTSALTPAIRVSSNAVSWELGSANANKNSQVVPQYLRRH